MRILRGMMEMDMGVHEISIDIQQSTGSQPFN